MRTWGEVTMRHEKENTSDVFDMNLLQKEQWMKDLCLRKIKEAYPHIYFNVDIKGVDVELVVKVKR